MAISLWPHFFGSPCILVRLLDKQLLSQTVESACTKLRVLAVAGCYSHCGLMMARCLTAMSVVCRRPSLARSTTSGAFTLASATFRKPSTCMLSVSVLLADLRTPSFCFAVYCKSVTLVFWNKVCNTYVTDDKYIVAYTLVWQRLLMHFSTHSNNVYGHSNYVVFAHAVWCSLHRVPKSICTSCNLCLAIWQLWNAAFLLLYQNATEKVVLYCSKSSRQRYRKTKMKVRNQEAPYVSTLPNYCFGTTWQIKNVLYRIVSYRSVNSLNGW